MRIVSSIVTIAAAVLLSLFAYEFRPGSFFGDAAFAGVPLWSVCGVVAVGLVVVAIAQVRRPPLLTR